MEFKAKVLGVEAVLDGIVIIVQQEKIKIPVAEEQNTDEALVAKKIMRGMTIIGFPVDAMECQRNSGLKTPIWLTTEDYENMGKPTVGDTLQFRMDKLQEEEWKTSKPLTPVPPENLVLFMMKQLQVHSNLPELNPPVEKAVLIQEVIKHYKFTEEEIEKALHKLLRDGTLYEPKENCLKITSPE